MTQEEFLVRMARCLEEAGIPFMVAGSHGSSFYGRPRATHDADLVIDPTPQQLGRFMDLLGSDYYVSRPAAEDALRRRSLFNVIDFTSGWKADLIVRKDRPFSAEEFRRRQPVRLYGRSLPLASPEDIILTKLEWNRITPSERQRTDALEVAVACKDTLDRAYLRHWAPSLGVAEALEELLRHADAAQPRQP